ncbi:MAG: hypothetical protein EOM11_10325 [Erysipelotrichia bacterium]|nr:hypothetical protein [Erysipelotrichia bacterium]
MTLIKNKKFKAIFKGIDISSREIIDNQYDSKKYPYIGMGNPDSKVLFVGAEKGFDPEESSVINKHELNLNYIHWQDILLNHNNLNDHLHPRLKLREGLTGFNPFSPLSLDVTCNRVYSIGGHTYKQMEKICNASLLAFHSVSPKNIFQVSPHFYNESMFKYCFLTELSDLPKKTSEKGVLFSNDDFKKSARYSAIKGLLGDFYRSFKTVVIYAGRKYAETHCTTQRLDVIKLFNPKLNCNDLINHGNGANGQWLYDVYKSSKGGAKVVVCRHIVSQGTTAHDLEQLIGVIGMGDIL